MFAGFRNLEVMVTLEKAVLIEWFGQMANWFEQQKGGEKVEAVGLN